MTVPSQPLFLYGPGYSATVLAQIWLGPVAGTYRSETARAALADLSIDAIAIDDAKGLSAALENAHLVVSAPPGEAGCPAFAALGDQAARAASVTYLSTTGVYGDLRGGWAMEWTPANPQSARALRRLKAEQAWTAASTRTRIVRLPGIYGPGRSMFDRLRRGDARRIIKPGQVFSRIHVDDLAAGLKALLNSDAFGVFNLCDDVAAPPQDVVTYAADLLGLAPPPEIAYETADLSPMARSFYGECKRVSNARLKAATGWRPRYPSYRQGLGAILADNR